MTLPQAGQLNRKFNYQETVVPIFISIVGAMIALFPSNPNSMTLPSRDSGVFLYVGWRFLNGDIPYRDVWDHKPPLIYFVDALGLKLSPDSLWGVWLLQIIFIFSTILIIHRLLDKEFGTYAAIAGSITLTSGILTILERGNVTEEYALVFQALCLWLFLGAWKNNFPTRTSLWIGLWGGLAFNFKQTTIGIWIAYALILLAIRLLQRKSPVVDFLSLLAGWLIPSVVFIIYFASLNALADYWGQAFLYNFVYIQKHEWIGRLMPTFVKGFLYLQRGGVLYLAALGWLTGLIYVLSHRKGGLEKVQPLILIALVSLPIEVALITVSGRSILHYYLTPLPIMAILTGVIIYTVPRLLTGIQRIPFQKIQEWTPRVLLIAIILLQYGQIKNYPYYISGLAGNSYASVIDYVVKNTKADDKVLIIGAESVVNFLTRRVAPTRYVYQYPLGQLGLPNRQTLIEEFFQQIMQNNPIMIIDSRGRDHLDEKLYEPVQKRSEIVRAGVQYLGEHYQQVAQFDEWFVYRLIDK